MDEKREHTGGGYDAEINVRQVAGFTIGLLGVTAVVLVVMWWMSSAFKRMDEANDPPPSPVNEAQLDPIPPGPRLQPAPPRDMAELRAEDQKILGTYGWVDQAGGVARIPVDRAISILAERGLPKTPPPAASARPGEVTSAAPAAPAASASAKPIKPPHKKKEPK
jgi:hypothetical protein